MPADIDVTPHSAAVDDVLTSPGGTDGAALIAIPVRQPCLDKAGDADAADTGPSWADATGTDTTALGDAIGLTVAEVAAAYGLSGKAGQGIKVAARTAGRVVRLVLLGTGDGTDADLRRAGAALARQVEAGATALAALPRDTDPDPFVEGVRLGGYRFSLRSRDREDSDHEQKGSRSVRLLTQASSPAPRAGVAAAAVSLARDLVNTPGRLVLADLLGYAATLDPGTIVDLATLTGAVRIALGGQIGALYASEDDLVAAATCASSPAPASAPVCCCAGWPPARS